MKGSLQKKFDYWYLVVSYKDENGKFKTKWINTNCTKEKDARKYKERVDEAIEKGIENPYMFYEFSMFIKEWIEKALIYDVEKTTYDGYVLTYKNHILPYFTNKDIEELEPIDIQNFANYLLKDCGLESNTVRRIISMLRKALGWGVSMKYISKNVAKSVKLPKAKYTEKNFYTKDEIKKLLIAVKDTELETPVMLAVNYGLRRGEVLGLRWMDIDFENNKILIQNTRTKLGENIEKKPKSESSRRSLPLYPSFKQYLLQLKEKNNGKDLDYVCLNNLGKPMPTSVLNANFNKLLNKNNLRHIRFHDLRHTNASLLLSLGSSLKEIQEWLGHAMFKTTADLYTHISVELKNLNADRLENFTQEIGV